MSKTNEECNIELINAFQSKKIYTEEDLDIYLNELKTNNHLFTQIYNTTVMHSYLTTYNLIFHKYFPETLKYRIRNMLDIEYLNKISLENINHDIFTEFLCNALMTVWVNCCYEGDNKYIKNLAKYIRKNINHINIENLCDRCMDIPYFVDEACSSVLDIFINSKMDLYKYSENIVKSIRLIVLKIVMEA